MVCRANLGQIGKAMLIYAEDCDGALPRAGGPSSRWEAVVWNAPDRYAAHDLLANAEGGKATISSCFYLLVKYLEMPPPLFVCPGDWGTTPVVLADEDVPTGDFALSDAFDFGAQAYAHCSYSYHMPFRLYTLNVSRDPNFPVAADRSPWVRGPAYDVDTTKWTTFTPDIPPYNGSVYDARQGNALSHEKDGQNVLFLDGRVAFEPRAYCGVEDDNIYTQSMMSKRGDPKGELPMVSRWLQPTHEIDSLLVHDPPLFPSHRPRR